MYELLRRWTLAVLKAPPEPQPPIGDPASLRVFRAGKNYFRLRIAQWLVVEILALAGLLFWTAFLIDVGARVREQKEARANQKATIGSPEATTDNVSKDDSVEAVVDGRKRHRQAEWQRRFKADIEAAAAETKAAARGAKKGNHVVWWAGFRQASVEFATRLPAGAIALIWAIKIFSALLYFIQLPITYAVRRLDYEMRWYMVTDRSLRLRYGVWKIAESTMSFANIQQVVVSQGPLQRLLGLGDVKVKSAGGGGGGDGHYENHEGDDMHSGLFHSVTNATEIRDLILERLRRFREAGLGDPDEKISVGDRGTLTKMPENSSSEGVAAARELLLEARALRAAFSTR